jgi:hypothetical protein
LIVGVIQKWIAPIFFGSGTGFCINKWLLGLSVASFCGILDSVMIHYLIYLAILTTALYALIPQIPGVEYHGGFVISLLVVLAFVVAQNVITTLFKTLSFISTVSTFGLAQLVIMPSRLIGFWLIPAAILKVVASFPDFNLRFHGWVPAIVSGLVLVSITQVSQGTILKKGKKRD